MTTNRYYEQIVSSMPPGLERQVMRVLQGHVGSANRVSREQLVEAVFQRHCPKDSTEDRQVREAISKLQERFMILSDSGRGGYFLPSNLQEVNLYTAEIVSRARELEDKARRLKILAEREFGPGQQMGLGL